jgi:hypothetical protein
MLGKGPTKVLFIRETIRNIGIEARDSILMFPVNPMLSRRNPNTLSFKQNKPTQLEMFPVQGGFGFMDGSQLLRDTAFVNEPLNFNRASASEDDIDMSGHESSSNTRKTTRTLTLLLLNAVGARTIELERAPISTDYEEMIRTID